MILRQLRDDIYNRISSDEQNNAHAYITSIIDTCLDYNGGLEDLFDILHYFERNSRSIEELDALLDRLFPLSIKHAHLGILRRLVTKTKWSIEVLERAYRAAAPPGIEWHYSFDSPETEICTAMLNILADAPHRIDGNLPILLFIHYLIRHLGERSSVEKINPQSSYHKLKRCSERITKENGFKKISIHNTLLSSAHPAVNSPSLLIALKEDAHDNHLFTVEAWLLDSQYASLLQLYAGNEHQQKSLQDVGVLLDFLLAESRRYLGREAMEQLIVEFSLPFSMIGCNVDHWIVKVNQYTSVHVGIEHRVFVRSYDRAHNRDLWDSWKSMWQRYQAYLQGSSVSPFLICPLEEDEIQASFYAKLKRHMFVCIALTAAPPEIIFQTMIGFGIPIALWTRQPTNQINYVKERFASLLSGCKLSDLPDLVWHQRMEAFDTRDNQHLGQHLTLLWDDPYRLPPDIQNISRPFQAPRKGRIG